MSFTTTNHTRLWTERELRAQFGLDTPQENEDMGFTNPAAAAIAKEILDEDEKATLRDAVTAAVRDLQEYIKDLSCGSVFSFMKENDRGQHYFYAAIKNGDKWYTTAQNPRVIESDHAFIEWLIGLEIYSRRQLELIPGSPHEPAAIEATTVES